MSRAKSLPLNQALRVKHQFPTGLAEHRHTENAFAVLLYRSTYEVMELACDPMWWAPEQS